jgi:hypothetical protein
MANVKDVLKDDRMESGDRFVVSGRMIKLVWCALRWLKYVQKDLKKIGRRTAMSLSQTSFGSVYILIAIHNNNK